MELHLLRTLDATPWRPAVLLVTWVHGSLQFFALGLLLNVLVIRLMCYFWSGCCVQDLFAYSFLLIAGCWRALGQPSRHHWAPSKRKPKTNRPVGGPPV